MKKLTEIILALVLAGILALSFVSCTKSSDSSEPSNTASSSQEDGGQNPVMNVVGKYENGGCYITVEAEGSDSAKFTVEWPMTDEEKEVYSFSGVFDTDTLKVTYSNSTKTVQSIAPDGTVLTGDVEYSDGTGVVVFREDGSLEWLDDNEAERMTDNQVFTFAGTAG